MNEKIYKISEINNILKKMFDNCTPLRNISLKGEVSNYSHKKYAYFTLKDELSSISANIFDQNIIKKMNDILKNDPNPEINVIGSISVYVPRGNYSITMRSLELSKSGDIFAALKKLEQNLRKEGLFEKNKPIPKYPENIAIITSKEGAALRDMYNTIIRRYPIVNLYVFPAFVQGDKALDSIINQIKYVNNFKIKFDTLIISRGGGSKEDMWFFNDERIVREIYSCNIPVITGIGHEIDTTLSDLAADLRAATPTGAAELAVPDIEEINKYLNKSLIEINTKIKENLLFNKDFLINSKSIKSLKINTVFNDKRRFFQQLEHYFENSRIVFFHNQKEKHNNFKNSLLNNINKIILKNEQRLNLLNENLKLLGPNNIIKRGYSITMDKDNKVISLKSKINNSDKIRTILKDGEIISTIKEIKEYKNEI